VHKYATALWLFDQDITSVQAVVRQAPIFFEAPTAAIWEYERETLLGMMEVTYAPRMSLRSSYYGADEFFEIQGTDGFLWVTRATGEMLGVSSAAIVHADAWAECARAKSASVCLAARLKPDVPGKKEEQL